MEYLVSKGGLGQARVSYRCPKCGADLASPIEDAGSTDQCPECRRELVVPGEVELMRLHTEAERSREAERARRREAEEQRRPRAARADDTLLDYESARHHDDAAHNGRRGREAADAIDRMQRPGEYKEILAGVGVVGVMGVICYVVGFVGAGGGLILFLNGLGNSNYGQAIAGVGLLTSGVGYLVAGALLKLMAGLSLAIRDIAAQTHHTMIARAIPKQG